jgi:hypothetical protein
MSKNVHQKLFNWSYRAGDENDLKCNVCEDKMLIDCPNCDGTSLINIGGGEKDHCPCCENIKGKVLCPECN